MAKHSEKSNVKYLARLLALAAIVLLILAYYLLDPKTSWLPGAVLIHQTIPSMLAVLIGFVVVHWLLIRRGIRVNDVSLSDESVEALSDALSATVYQNIEGVLRFYENFRTINWHDIIADAQNLDIIVCYYDSWIQMNWEVLRAFFNRGGELRLFLGDPNDPFIVKSVHLRFPDLSSEDRTKEKIESTGRRLITLFEDEDLGKKGMLSVYYANQPPNYSAVIINSQRVLLSVYEQYRKQKVDSCAVLLDLSESEHLTRYWTKELDGFLENSRLVYP